MCIRADFMYIYAYFICIYLGVVVQINSSQILSGPCVSSASDWRLCKNVLEGKAIHPSGQETPLRSKRLPNSIHPNLHKAQRKTSESEWPGNPARTTETSLT